MPGVLDALASYVANMLTEMAKEEVAMLIGVSSGIDDLAIKLADLNNFLADADRRTITDPAVQVWVSQLKRAMYDATDILDLCQLKVMEQIPSADRGCLNPLLFCMRNPVHAHDIGSRIKVLNEKLDDISRRARRLDFIHLEPYQEPKTIRPPPTSRKTDPLLERSDTVGEKIEEDTRVLVEMLAKEVADESPLVVAIVGMGGIGKTTLGKKVFNDPAIQGKFSKKIWLSITQDFSDVELLRTAITGANGDLPGLGVGGGQDKGLLVLALAIAIRGKKFFLVLDDMWDTNVWNNLLKAPFMHGASGSRVLITTRHNTVARGMRAVHPYHHVDRLGPEVAWSLLKKQVVSNETDGPNIDMLKDIGLQIIEKCDGLPLAIKVMGGLLCQMDKQRHDWERVLNNSIWSGYEMPEELSFAIYLSYEDLPPCIKQCFLYYSLLPKSTVFYRDEIIGMWISEGFIHGDSCVLEELGKMYHKELISRNLLEPDIGYVDQCVCNMHNVVRSFAQFVARDEALAVHSGETDIISKLNSQRLIRLSIETKWLESDELERRLLQSQISLRTLILIGHFMIQPGDSMNTFSNLRTLHIESASFPMLVECFYQLKHLRYLSIAHTDVPILPENIGNMKFLQHISLLGCESLVKLPGSIVKLWQLRYLSLGGSSISGIPRGFCGLINLRRLYGFPAYMEGDWCSLEELGPISQLRTLGLNVLESIPAISSIAKARLDEKVHLTELFASCNSRLGSDGLVIEEDAVSEEEKRQIEEVFDELSPPHSLEHIDIKGYFGQRLPKWMMSTAAAPLNRLKILIMYELACCTKLPDGLCQLPCLQHIQICHAPAIKFVGPEFLQPYHPSQSVTAFPRLLTMKLIRMVEWEEWVWTGEVQAFPVLEEFLLDSCKLSCFPPGLAFHASALKRLVITDAPNLSSLDSLTSVVELGVCFSQKLTSITNLPKLQRLKIEICPEFKILTGVPALRKLVLEDYTMKTLPGYLQDVINLSRLELDCSLELLTSIAVGQSGPEWGKFSHMEHVRAYAHDGDNRRKWYMQYTRKPYNLDTNISHSSVLTAIGSDEDELVGTDNSSDSAACTVALCKDNNEIVGTNSPSESAVALRKEENKIVGTDSLSESAVALGKDDKEHVSAHSSSEPAAFCKDDHDLVGVGRPCNDIIKALKHGEDIQLKMVSICGMGGLGKTTIAKAVYRKTADEFGYRAFVSVSRANIKEIIRSICDQVGYSCSNYEEFGVPQLVDGLGIFLKDKRYLIVLDDIWAKSVWDQILHVLKDNNQRSRIITTTRKIAVAEHVGGLYHLPLLSDSDSKMLFYRRTIFGSEDHCPTQFRDLSRRMLSRCGQLPLAIIGITDLLPKHTVLEAWQKVCNSIEMGESVKDMRRVLEDSYDDLSEHVKPCLLYLSIFPEGYEIRRDSLVQRWIAEDLIRCESGQNLQELGERYFSELVNSSMIQPKEVDKFREDLAYRLPVTTFDFIVYLSIKNKYVAILPGLQRTHLPNDVRRLSLQVSNEQHDVLIEDKIAGQVTSLSIFSGAHLMQPLSKFHRLHVLDLEKCDSLKNQYLKDLRYLVELRFLVLGGSHVTEIPEKVWKLRHLQTLDLMATGVKKLSSSIVKLTQLRHLLINISTEVPDGIIGKLQALEELVDIDISKSPSILDEVSTLPELRVLSIALWSSDEHHSKLLSETLHKLSTQKLKSLSISTCCSLDLMTDLRPVLQHLEKLEIQGSTFNSLPNWIRKEAPLAASKEAPLAASKEAPLAAISEEAPLAVISEEDPLAVISEEAPLAVIPKEAPLAVIRKEAPLAVAVSNLRSLSIEVYSLGNQHLRILGELSHLLCLSLAVKKIPGEKLVVCSVGFSSLETFLLCNRAMAIKFEQGAMKRLERLKLTLQASLTEDFCFGLERLSSLKHVQVEIICFSATGGAVHKAEAAIEAMIRDNPNNPTLKITRTAEKYMIVDEDLR